MRRRRRKVSAIHAGPRPRPAAASSKQRGRGLGTAGSAGGARAARRRRCPGSPEAQTAEPVSTPADWASPRAAALRAGDRRAGPWSAEASRRDSSILLNVVPHSAPVGPPPHPSIVPQPQTGVPWAPGTPRPPPASPGPLRRSAWPAVPEPGASRSTLQGRSTDQAQLSLLLRRGPSRPRSSGLPFPSLAGLA
nr:CASP-like protein 4A2 [Rattus norvegicus]